MTLVLGTNCGIVSTAPTADPAGDGTRTIDNYKRAVEVVVTETITIVEMGWWCDTASQAANYDIGIYDDNAGVPNNRLYVSTGNAKGTTAGWKVVSGLSWQLTAGTYWLAVSLQDTSTATGIDYGAITGTDYAYQSGSPPPLPDPFGSTSTFSNQGLAIYGLTGAVGPTITDVDTDEDIHDQQEDVAVTGTSFETQGGNSRVRINSQADGLGTDSVQTIASWSDTSIEFDVVKGSLSYGTNYLFVRNQSMQENAIGFQINLYDYLNVTGLSDTSFRSGDTGIVISGQGFGASQGSSEVILSSQADGGGTTVDQTVTSWGETSITFTVVQGALTPGTVYCFVERNQAGQGDSGPRLSNGTTCTLQEPVAWRLASSTYFANKDPTTAQLSVPESGTFVAGQMLESSNPGDEIALGADQYSEWELCLEATAESQAGAQYEFRFVDPAQAGEKLETYSVIPKVTLQT